MKMYIKQLVVYGYGKWENKTIDLKDGFVAFLGANEMGKSTLQSFIQHMLFGLPKVTRKKDVNLYVPKTSSRYGGQLILDDTPYGLVTIERVRTGKTTVKNKITTQEGIELTQDILEKLLGGLTIELYEQFFSIQLQQLQALNAIEKEALNRYFLTVGLSGSESLFEWYDSWLKASDKLYRPNASKLPLNEKLDRYREQVELVDRLASQQESYGQFSLDIKAIEDRLEQLKGQENVIVSELHQLEKIKQLLPSYENYQRLSSKTFQTELLEKDIDLQYRNLLQQKELIEEQLLRSKDRLTTMTISEELVWFRQHEKDIKYAVMSLPKVEQTLKTIANADYQIEIKKEALFNACQQININTEQLPEKEIVLSDDIVVLLDKQQEIQTNLQKQEELLVKVNERIDNEKIQQQIIFEQREHYQELSKEQEISSVKSFNIAYLLGVCSVLAAVGLVIFNQLVFSIIGLALGVVFGLTGFLQSQSKHRTKQQREEQVLRRLQQYDDRLVEKEQLIAIYKQEQQLNQQHYVQLEEKLEQLNHQLLSYKQVNQIPETIDLYSIKEGKLNYAYTLKSNISQLVIEKETAMTQLQLYNDIFSFFDSKVHSQAALHTLIYQRERLTQFKQYVDTWQVEDYKLQQSNLHQVQQEKDIVSLQNNQKLISEKIQKLFEKVGVQSALEFEKMLDVQRVEQKEMQELSMLKGHLGEHLQLFNQFDENKMMTLNENLNSVREQQHHYLAQLAKLKQELAFLEQDGQFSVEKQRLALIEQAVIQEIKQVGAYQLAAKMVELILQQGKSQNSDTIIAQTSQLFSRITQERYINVMFIDDVLQVKRNDNQLFALHELSMGTLDQLYIALRLAFINSVQDRVNVPLIIDDCFVNFDATRKQAMLNILKDYATQQQIVYLTYDNDINQQGVYVVELSQE